MPRILILAALAAGPALLFGETPVLPTVPSTVQQKVDSTPSVGIFMDFDAKPAPTSVDIMEKETDSLLKAAGVSLDWRMAKDAKGNQPFNGLVVLKFKGKCRVEGWANRNTFGGPLNDFGTLGESAALGKTKVSHGEVLPYTEVECDKIREALEYLHPNTSPKEQQQAFGLALGRVVAHELYHILANTTHHATHGLAKASESLLDLVSNTAMPFGAEDSKAIRKGLLNAQ